MRFLAAQGAPVVKLASEYGLSPHESELGLITFWHYEELSNK